MFIDETTIRVKAGDGGNGCFAYEREKYKPRGRPSGGCGGRGGHIYIIGANQCHTLRDVAYRKSYHAQRGTHGKGSNRDGKMGRDLYIPVPLGTIIRDAETNQVIGDCSQNNQKILIARGGRGGRGNVKLTTRSNPNPQQVEPGRPGKKRILRLELKLLADIGLVGKPNAGKSTFLSVISKAHPRIADYPFTTREPHLGVVNAEAGRSSFVVADIPGLISGAHQGKGMGIRFLKHIERTRILAVMVEATSEDPCRDRDALIRELSEYSSALGDKPRVDIVTKIDAVSPEQRDKLAHKPGWLLLSSLSGEGVATGIERFRVLLDKQLSEEDE